ncbi:MAG TPA: hypothetical protein VHG72_21645 [Polyangia bacterium]|nr:hypothetical protein [Polyangia bacterium]
MTLVDELEQAAQDATATAESYRLHADKVANARRKQEILEARAARLRARAGRIRVISEDFVTPSTEWSKGYKAALLDITVDLELGGAARSKP